MSNPLIDRTHSLFPKYNWMTEEEYDQWARERIEESLDDDSPGVPHEQVMAEAHTLIAKRRRNPKPKRWCIRQVAFGEGWFVRTAGGPIEVNPHDERRSNARWRWWRQGWLSATTHPSKRN
jgi:hypothetical protein